MRVEAARTHNRLNPFVLAAALLLAAFAALATPNSVGAASCESRDAVGHVPFYTVEICITSPTAGSTLTGARSVSASVTVSTGGPGVQRVSFSLDGQPILTDYAAPFTFTLPTQKFVDGPKTLQAEALLRDGFKSNMASISLNFNNGNTSPPVNTNSFTPSSGTTPPAGQAFKVQAAGDGASGEPGSQAVTDLVAGSNPNLFLYLGDVYEKGTSTEFYNWYGTASTFFGRFRSKTNPTVGNHEYENNQAPGYFDYWDNVPNYYSFDAGGWHFISLNSNTAFDQVAPGTQQYQWLENDLQTRSTTCTLAYMHHPVFSIGPQGDTTRLSAMWSLLASYGVDIVLTAHDHDYQRWVPLNGSGAPSALGPTQFVVGTGGHGTQGFVRSDSRVAASLSSDVGALELRLGSAGATYDFLNPSGTALDSGSLQCSGSGSDTSAPSAPSGLSATSPGTRVDLSWTASSDNVGVTGYKIYRDGTLLADVPPAPTTYVDGTVAPSTTYTYEVRARDAAGNLSAPSNSAVVTIGPQTILFSDGFESGDFSQWTSNAGMTVQQQETFSGAYAARATSTGAATWAYEQLANAETNVFYRVRFKVVSLGSTANFMKFRTPTGTSILGVYVSSTGKLSYRNDIAGVSTMSTTTVSQGTWHTVQVQVLANGAASQTETFLDGVRIDALSKTENFGTAAVGRVQIGENSTARIYDFVFDGLSVATSFVGDSTAPSTPALTLTESSAFEHVNGSDVYYNPAGSGGSFKVDASASDAESGVMSAAFPATFGADAGVDNVEPFSKTYSWTPGASATGSRTVWATNGAGLSSGSAFGVIPDSSVPTGGSIGYIDGYVSTNAVLLSLGDGTDTGSGIDENGESLERAEAPLSGGACGTFGGYVAVIDVPVFDFLDLSVASGRCYKYRFSVPDRVANRATFTSGSIVKVDADAPAVTLSNPGATVSGTVNLDATATDAGGSGLQDVRFERSPAGANSWTTISTDATSPYAAAWDSTQVADGNYDLRAIARDGAGGTTASGIQTVAVDNVVTPPPDTTPPVVSLTAPADAATVSATTTISADATDNVAVQQVEFLVDGSVVGSDSSSPYSINWDTTSHANGAVTITARATDTSNNSTTSSGHNVTIDNNNPPPPGDTTPPSVSLADPGAFMRGTKTLTATASDTSGIAQVAFQISPMGANTWSTVDTDTSAPYSTDFVTTSVADGRYDLRAVATDLPGNSASSVVGGRTIDNTGATGSITAPASGATVGGTIAVTATATDAGSGVSQITFERSPAGANTWTALGTDTTQPYSVDWMTTSVTDGNYDVRGVMLDDAGNQSTTPAVTVTVKNRYTFAPAADSYVSGDFPTKNYGTANTLRVDSSPEVRSYIRFNVQVPAQIVRATLRVFTASSSSSGYQVRGVADTTWGETTITFSNAPPVSSTVTGSFGAFANNQWTEVDVTSLVAGTGLVSFGLTTSSSTNKSFSSRESGANAPQLIVETG